MAKYLFVVIKSYLIIDMLYWYPIVYPNILFTVVKIDYRPILNTLPELVT